MFGGIRDEFAPTQSVFQATLSPHFLAKFAIPFLATTVSAASYDGSPQKPCEARQPNKTKNTYSGFGMSVQGTA